MADMRTEIRNQKDMEVDKLLDEQIEDILSRGYSVEFGKIGTHTSYALLVHQRTGEEIVGYTFIKDLKYYRENVGKLKALQQAIARKKVVDSRE